MRIIARIIVEDKKIALECKPFLRASYTVYIAMVDEQWTLPSGRPATLKMLDAIDQLPGVAIVRRPRLPNAAKAKRT